MSRPATPHAAHDELLIARLFGVDVDDRERTLAQEQIAGCEECAALFADLVSIARATVALPVPTRPKDFSLSAADAARLRPSRRGWARLVGLGRRRSFGGALVALGFSGLLLTGAFSILGPRSTSQSLFAGLPGERAASDGTGSTANFGPAATPAPAATAAPAFAAPSPATADGGAKGGAETAAPVAVPTPAPATPAPASTAAMGQQAASPPAGGAGSGGVTPAQGQPAPTGQTMANTASQSGPDSLQLIVVGSSAALALGILVLLAPALRRRFWGRPDR